MVVAVAVVVGGQFERGGGERRADGRSKASNLWIPIFLKPAAV